ncbi:hypothetical protein ACEPUD_00755 [Burkholderia ubonensis]|uniref:hypothetical protein n=1 Tax=Burkholderia ubonensis TaxID=101571 RepID=UPI0035900F73
MPFDSSESKIEMIQIKLNGRNRFWCGSFQFELWMYLIILRRSIYRAARIQGIVQFIWLCRSSVLPVKPGRNAAPAGTGNPVRENTDVF